MRVLLIVLVASCLPTSAGVAQPTPVPDGIAQLLSRLETALAASDRDAAAATFDPATPAGTLASFLDRLVRDGATRAVVRERDRVTRDTAPRRAVRMVLDVFIERGREASVFTIAIDARQAGGEGADSSGTDWRFAAPEVVSFVDGLYRLEVNPRTMFKVRNLVITAEDLELRVPSGSAFPADTTQGTTAMVVLGRGELRFTPKPAAERGQVRLFSGSERLVTPFSAVFVRFHPAELKARFSAASLTPTPVNAGEAARARRVFDEEVSNSFNLSLEDLSPFSWSLIPTYGDVLAEIRTNKYGTLTYAKSSGDPEDVTLFDRRRRRNISVYASEQRRNTTGPSYDEDALADYDILDYDLEASFSPAREWIEGRARLTLRVREFQLATLTLRLHENLVIRGVASEQHGRLLALRVKGQNSFLVSLPKPVGRGDLLTINVAYAGRHPPLQPDREVVAQQEPPPLGEGPVITPEERYVYSTRSYWYPQGSVTDFATARLRLAVPAGYTSLASGSAAAGDPTMIQATRPGDADIQVSNFVAGQPVRYLSWVITKLTPVVQATVPLARGAAPDGAPAPVTADAVPVVPGVHYDAVDLFVTANPRQVGRARAMARSAEDILQFYSGLLGDLPYPTFTLALVDSELPGGHSPAYFALLYQPLPMSRLFWRNDPVYFDSFPEFFLAHELAHQFWGQAVGWQSYHDQWISEGFAQYFAALYAERHGSRATFREIVRRMRESVLDKEEQGPISLGYRLGHIRGEGRVFRAIVYNKGALVLHMLRRLLGDNTFFRGLAQLYGTYRFTKAGTDEVRLVFEQVSGRPLERFFERWVRSATLPRVRWSWRLQGADAHVSGGDGSAGKEAPARASQTNDAAANPQPGPAAGDEAAVIVRFDLLGAPADSGELPITVSLLYRDGSSDEVIVVLDDTTKEARIPVRGVLQDVDVNRDHAALARFEKR